MAKKNKILENIVMGLVAIGGLTWGTVGLFGFNLVTEIGLGTIFERTIYSLVGFATAYLVYKKFN